mmetsp:Transcript_28859/g.61337  ORF Transcript_28859/g.61337 Transcript_28859/m.61337 type:complete len:225 (+) Transcript_28859:1077-1751(+)
MKTNHDPTVWHASERERTAPTLSFSARAGFLATMLGFRSAARCSTMWGLKSSTCSQTSPSSVRSQTSKGLGNERVERARISKAPQLKTFRTSRPRFPVPPVMRTRGLPLHRSSSTCAAPGRLAAVISSASSVPFGTIFAPSSSPTPSSSFSFMGTGSVQRDRKYSSSSSSSVLSSSSPSSSSSSSSSCSSSSSSSCASASASAAALPLMDALPPIWPPCCLTHN